MEKVIVDFGDVRGLGNIVSPTTTDDYNVVNGQIASISDMIQGKIMSAYSLVMLSDYIVLTVPRLIRSGETVTISASLVLDRSPATGKTVKFYYEEVE